MCRLDFFKCVFQQLGILAQKFEDSDILFRFPLSIVFVRSFPEEALKLLVGFLSLSIFARAAEVFLSTDLLRYIRSCCGVVNRLTARLMALLWYLACP